MQSRAEPKLVKVGFTSRKTVTRRSEVNRIAGDDMRIVYTVSMPWASNVEQHVLRSIRRNSFRRGDRRGTEWFWLHRTETVEAFSRKIERSSIWLELVAKANYSWPVDTERRTFRAQNLNAK